MATNQIYKALNIMKFNDIYEYNLLKFFISSKNEDNDIWNDHFALLQPSHGYTTRTHRLNLPTVRTEVEKSGTIFQCVRANNSMPDSLRDIESIESLKRRYKKHCINQYWVYIFFKSRKTCVNVFFIYIFKFLILE